MQSGSLALFATSSVIIASIFSTVQYILQSLLL